MGFIEQVMLGGLHLAPRKDKAATPNRKRNSTDVGNGVVSRQAAFRVPEPKADGLLTAQSRRSL